MTSQKCEAIDDVTNSGIIRYLKESHVFRKQIWSLFFSLSSQEFNRLFLRHLVNSNLINLVVLWQVHYFVLK